MDYTGADVTQITHHSRPIFLTGFHLSPDDKWFVYSVNESTNRKNLDIYKIRTDGSEQSKLISMKDGSKEFIGSWSKNGKMIGFTTDCYGYYQPGIYYTDSGEIRLFGDGNHDEEFALFTDDGSNLITNRNIDAEMKLVNYRLDTGEEKLLNLGGFNISDSTIVDGRTILVAHQDAIHRQQYLFYNLDSNAYEVILPASYGEFKSEVDFYKEEYVNYASSDNTQIYSILYKPKEISNDEKLPAIILPHGGPTAQYFRNFFAEAQIFTDQGYVLLLPNVRGSTGYGTQFRDACIKDWGGKDLEDIKYGAEYLQSLPYVDSDRIGITGGSYGGYLTFMSLTKLPDLFRVGIPQVGITSLLKLYERNKDTFPALTFVLEEKMGKPDNEETKKLWEDRSAINFIQNLKAKIKIVHTVNDPRCPLEQAEIFKEKLLELGKEEGRDFEYVVFEDQGHGSADIKQNIEWTKQTLEYLEKYL
jgi:dipeptidyl aminopeptidase/acylaminoacyl peptidase